jgi:hypothetical protein
VLPKNIKKSDLTPISEKAIFVWFFLLDILVGML